MGTGPLMVEIEGDIYEVDEVINYGYLPMIRIGRWEYYIAQDSEEAGEKAREYWEDLAHDDPKEFTYLIGEETLIQWGLGQYAGPGSTQVCNLQEWLDLWLDTPEEQWASYDGHERDCRINKNLQEELGYTNRCVCYRNN